MRALNQIAKSLALRILPNTALRVLKRRRYLRLLRDAGPEVEPNLRVVRHLVRPGALAIDIGANIGLYTRWLSEWVGPEGQVVSIEPIPETHRYLIHNIDRLRLTNVVPLQCAISSSNGRVTMEIPRYEAGGENFYRARIIQEPSSNEALTRVSVNTRTLDTIVEECGRMPGFVKCDVEGHELECLRGARAVLDHGKPAWLIEIADDPNDPSSRASAIFWRTESSIRANVERDTLIF